MDVIETIKSLDLSLPKASVPGGNYKSVNIRGKIVYVAIQFPILDGDFRYQGRLGEDVSTDQGYKAMQLCALNVLAQIEAKVGFEQVLGLNHLDVYFLSGAGWDDAPKVANGASDLFVNVLGERGEHSRAIFGVDALPRNFCVGLTSTFTLK